VDDAGRLVRYVRRVLDRRTEELPAFPAVAAHLLPLLECDEVEVAELESLLRRDQGLVFRVLRAANSPLYGGVVPARSLPEAIMRLGVHETARLSLAAVSRSLFDVEDRARRAVFPDLWSALWRDGLVSAYGARMLSETLRVGDAETLFLAAAFRNVGALLVLRVIAGGRVRGRVVGRLRAPTVERVLAALEAEVGADYLARCRLPAVIVAAARLLRAPALPFGPETAWLFVIRLAAALSARAGTAPFVEPDAPLPESGAEAARRLGVDAERLALLELQFQELALQVEELEGGARQRFA